MDIVMIVRATRKLLPRLRATTAVAGDSSTTLLGDWYATLLPWRPRQTALFVSEHTLLPVLVPLAPAATVLARFPSHLRRTLEAHGVPAAWIGAETHRMDEIRLSTTTSRSLVGSMSEFAFLAQAHRHTADPDLLALSIDLARTPCGPLYRRHVSPDRELAALVNPQPT